MYSDEITRRILESASGQTPQQTSDEILRAQQTAGSHVPYDAAIQSEAMLRDRPYLSEHDQAQELRRIYEQS